MGEYQLYTRSQLTCVVVGCLVSVIGIFLKLLSLEAFEKGSGVDKDDTYQPYAEDSDCDGQEEQRNWQNVTLA